MDELGPATEHEMVLAFLQAEVDAPRWRDRYAWALQQIGATRALIDRPDLTSDAENAKRIDILRRVRGYRGNEYLFRGFPLDTTWRHVRLPPVQFDLLRHCTGAPEFIQLSRGTRRVVDAAANLDQFKTPTSQNIRAVVQALKKGQSYPPMVAVDSGEGELLLVEGYTRATAYAALRPPRPVEFFIGTSPNIRRWAFY
jgi:hypothetical protein